MGSPSNCHARLIDVASGKDRLALPGHTGPVGGVAFTPDGRTLLTAGDRSVRQWEVPGWRQQKRFEHLVGNAQLLRTNRCGAITIHITKDGGIRAEPFLVPAPEAASP